jgi:hypothetical protein
MKVLTKLRLHVAILGLASPLVPGAVGCGGGGGEQASVQATKESESKYDAVIQQQKAAQASPKK